MLAGLSLSCFQRCCFDAASFTYSNNCYCTNMSTDFRGRDGVGG